MQLIKSIEIKYFRSIYTLRIRNLKDLNIYSGSNDVGKSNILKALNLFFNGNTDWQTAFDFYSDFSAHRLLEVRKESIKGRQFISIAVEFNRPDSYKGSLPESFVVKRTWYRDSKSPNEQNNLDSLRKTGKIPANKLNTAKRFIQVFLNRLHYEYVPAAKDRLYYQYLLTRLQRSILNIPTTSDQSIMQITENLALHLEKGVDELKKDFQEATNIVSTIVPPSEISSLFQAFGVSTDSQSGGKIPLASRGDGIQARYMLSVLQYICKNSTDFFIWGLEEPENSLEYSRVVKMTEDLQKSYSKIAQILLTTHSPALTSLKTDNSTCYRVSSDEKGLSNLSIVWPEKGTTAEQRTKLNIEMGFMKLEEDLYKEYIEKSQEVSLMQKNIQSIEEQITQEQKAILITEGKFDVIILKTAWEKLRPGQTCPCSIISADTSGTNLEGGARMLAGIIGSVLPAYNKKAIAIFDRDTEGIKCFNSLSNFSKWNNKNDVKKHVNSIAFALLLPVPAGREEYARYENLIVEFMFSDNVLAKKTASNQGLVTEVPSPTVVVNNKKIAVPPEQLSLDMPSLKCHSKIVSGKDIFANKIVPSLIAEDFQPFESLFQIIENILS